MRSLLTLLASGLLGFATLSPAATIEGIVTEPSEKPIPDARIDHIGKMVIVSSTSSTTPPTADEIRRDNSGRFLVTPSTSAFVVHKPGYVSERILVHGDPVVRVVLRPVTSTTRCTLSRMPAFRTNQADDVDYSASWYFIETKSGRHGIVSGSGAMYTFGAPSDSKVQDSIQYSEFMYQEWVIDAAGQAAEGSYWRMKSIFGAAAQYFGQTREDALILDCVMDRVPLR